MGGLGVGEGPYGLSRLSMKDRLMGDIIGETGAPPLCGNREGWNSMAPWLLPAVCGLTSLPEVVGLDSESSTARAKSSRLSAESTVTPPVLNPPRPAPSPSLAPPRPSTSCAFPSLVPGRRSSRGAKGVNSKSKSILRGETTGVDEAAIAVRQRTHGPALSHVTFLASLHVAQSQLLSAHTHTHTTGPFLGRRIHFSASSSARRVYESRSLSSWKSHNVVFQ